MILMDNRGHNALKRRIKSRTPEQIPLSIIPSVMAMLNNVSYNRTRTVSLTAASILAWVSQALKPV